jgi:hypothetical protein
MENQSPLSGNLLVSREEMLYLLHAMGAQKLLVVDPQILENEFAAFLKNADQEKTAKSLSAKKILNRKGGKGYEIREDIRPVLETLFFPEHALFAVRDQPEKGRQVIGALRKNNRILFHSFPEEKMHSLRIMSGAEELFRFLIYWYPFFRLPISQTKSEIPLTIYERIQSLAKNGKTNEAFNLLNSTTLNSEEKKNFIHAIAEQKNGGTISWMQLKEGTIEQADAVDIVSDGLTGWLISQEKPSTPEGAILRLRRTGADLTMVIRRIVERFAGVRLPRQQTDPSGKFKRFTLNIYELAVALAAINCKDLAATMYSALSGDEELKLYSERMKNAQQSLVVSGLCTVNPQGVPILNEDLAQAVFSLAKADWQISITASHGGPNIETGIYIRRGQYFSAYYNHGEYLQVIESGKHVDAGIYMESLFPDFSTSNGNPELTFPISFDAVDKLKNKESDRQAALKVLAADGVADAQARSLAEDFSDSIYRVKLLRNNPPDQQKGDFKKEEVKEGKNDAKATLLLLLKSPRHNWLIHFQNLSDKKGKAAIANKETFRKALVDLLI